MHKLLKNNITGDYYVSIRENGKTTIFGPYLNDVNMTSLSEIKRLTIKEYEKIKALLISLSNSDEKIHQLNRKIEQDCYELEVEVTAILERKDLYD